MALLAVADIPSVVASIAEEVLGPFSHEVAVLCVFVLSFFLWRKLGLGSRRNRGRKAKVCTEDCADGKGSAAARRRTSNATRTPVFCEKKQAVEQSILRYLESREFTRALNLFRNLERDGRDTDFSEELFSTFIQSAIRVGKLDVVERMLRTMKKNGMQPSNKFWQTTLKMLSSRKHFNACLQVHSLFGSKIQMDKVGLSCLINAALDVGQPDRASALLEQYSKTDLEPKDHVLFFRTYQVLSDADAAEAVFTKLGKDTTNLMLNLLLLTCVNARQPERALRILAKAHAFERELPEDESIVDVVSYNTVIKGFAQDLQAQQCFTLLTEMRECGIRPDPITFGTLLELCIADNHTEIANAIVNLLLETSRPLDTVMCTLFIKGLVKANCLDRALELCEEMKKRRGAHPDIITFSVLIKALVDQHDLERAFGLLAELKEAGHQPDDIIYTHLLEGCRHASQHARGQQLFEEMLAAGVTPSEFTLVTMLKLHGRCGFHQEAFDMVAGWEKAHGMRPSVIHFTCLMSGCLRTKSYEQAWKAYELMCRYGVPADGTALSTLLPGMVAAQQWQRVVELAEVGTRGSCKIPSETLNNALAQMISSGAAPECAEKLRGMMQAAGVVLTRRATAPALSRRAIEPGVGRSRSDADCWRAASTTSPPAAADCPCVAAC